MKHSEDQLLFYCGGSQKPSQRAVWVHVRVSSFTAEVQTWQWRQLPLWVAASFLIWLMIGVAMRTGVASNHMTYDINSVYWIISSYVTGRVVFEWNFSSISVIHFMWGHCMIVSSRSSFSEADICYPSHLEPRCWTTSASHCLIMLMWIYEAQSDRIWEFIR